MGKKSRKKGGDKKSHKAKVQERRERLEEQQLLGAASASADNDEGYIDELTILVGDLVWFDREEYEYYNGGYNNPDPNIWRGIVRECSPPVYQVQPIANLLRDDSTCLEVDTGKHFLRRDTSGRWTTRFDVGDKVLCGTSEGWQSGQVLCLWPIWERRDEENPDVPVYKIFGPDFQV